MPIPDFREDGYLPTGHHEATWNEIENIFGDGSPRRQRIFRNLLKFLDQLKQKSINGRMLLDGSFISNKAEPGDFDALLILSDESARILELDPEARHLINYERCKKEGFDLLYFPEALVRTSPTWASLDVWDKSKDGIPKGCIEALI